MTTNPYLERGRPLPGRSDVKPQNVHDLTPNLPPAISHSFPKQKDGNQRCVKLAVAAVMSLLLLLLVTGVLLAYYFSSSCVHGVQCGDGSCVWESQWCDGARDCPAGQDEANCVRLHGPGFLLQIYSPQTKTWSSVCSRGWSDLQGRATCRTIGYSSGAYLKSGRQTTDSRDGFLTLKPDFNPDVFIVQQLQHSETCPDGAVVTLRCTDCGGGVNSSRASGAQQATLGSWPWQVSLQVSGSHRCGGAIISPYWIVTAAHCVSRSPRPADWAVYAGVVDPLGSLFNPARSVSRIIAHEGYSRLPRRNDVALMKLAKALDVSVSGNIRPVCLPNVGLNVSAPQSAWITQFGPTTDGGSPQLTEAQVSLIEAAECNSSAVYNGRLSQGTLCAGETGGGADTCHTDSGGPLVALRDGLWWLIGDSIWGAHCSERNKPGVYGNVTYFLDWIYRQMKEHQDD